MGCSVDFDDVRRETAGGIPFKLMEGYPKIQGDDEKTSATEKYVIRAGDVEAFYLESLPPPAVVLGNPILPARRKMPGSTVLITKTLSFEPLTGTLPGDPFDADAGAPAKTYDPLYVVTIGYETSSNDENNEQDPNDPETFLEHSITIGGEFLNIPPTKTTTASGAVGYTQGAKLPNRDAQHPIIKTIPTLEHQLKWKFCLSPNWARIIEYLGKISDRDEPLFLGAKKECVMFMGVSGNRVYSWNGRRLTVAPWNLDFRFTHRQIHEDGHYYGFNHVYSPQYGEWRRLFRAGGLPLHETANLRLLFSP